ncbi:IclR family transcriptional regulator [Natrinema longum]|uniref:IclR family transcriptional regulator n=1 Tax=Natrinema longum TaxID=370324 RepID=UPI001CCC86F6|nr:IclR family transcriptional regulator [Natrinema longum]MBZ6497073.1 IclR family transcriptional regulator [Natrinema longum]
MASDNNRNRRVKTADTVFGIVESIQALDGAGVTELSEELGLAKSTIHDHLSTMVEKEYLVKNDQTYQLGLKFLNHGIHARDSLDLLPTVQPNLKQMANETGEIAWFLVEEYGRGVYLSKAKGDRAVQPYGKIGNRVDLHSIAAGKAILAHLPEDEVRTIIEKHGLESQTSETITDTDQLFEELESIRQSGVAFNDGESLAGHRAVASPICPNDRLIGAIVVSGPKNRIQGDMFTEKIPEIVSGTANAIELELTAR